MTTDKLNEIWDRYDAHGMIIGTQRRGDPMPAGSYHLTVAVLIDDGAGNILLQRRSHSKLNQPDTWDVAAGGSALRGESASQAAARELQEELGLAPTLTYLTTCWHATWFEAVFTAIISPQTPLHLQTTEVSTTAWVPRAEAARRLAGHSTDWGALLAKKF